MRLSSVLATSAIIGLVTARPSKLGKLELRQSGTSTRNDPRPQKGNIPYGGAGVRTCSQPGTVAITFDDGPNIYTGQVLDTLASYGFKATFFVCGDNGHGALDGDQRWIDLLKRMDNEGHQIGSHTWAHPDLSTISDDARYDEMVKTEMAIRNILGKYPTYMRPPYASCDTGCQNVMKNLGYVISLWDLDTNDWQHQDNIQISKDFFKSEMDRTSKSGGRMSLAHDIHEQTATSLTPFMLQYLKGNGWRGVTLGECLGESKDNWYRTSTGSLPPSGCANGACSISPNGLCGAESGYTCAVSVFGQCCSRYGYCGSDNDYCSVNNCNPTYGTCSGGSTPTQPSNPTPTPSQPANPPSNTKPVSQSGLCGVQGGETCAGSGFGSCCSQWGYCGSTSAYCGGGCNKDFGTCS